MNETQPQTEFSQAFAGAIASHVERLQEACREQGFSLFVTVASRPDEKGNCEVRGTLAGKTGEIPSHLIGCDSIIRHGFVAVPVEAARFLADLIQADPQTEPQPDPVEGSKIVLSTH